MLDGTEEAICNIWYALCTVQLCERFNWAAVLALIRLLRIDTHDPCPLLQVAVLVRKGRRPEQRTGTLETVSKCAGITARSLEGQPRPSLLVRVDSPRNIP
jgi:hypothetical protein